MNKYQQDGLEWIPETDIHLDGPMILSDFEKLRAKYEKLGNAGIEGTSFQIDLLTVFFLNAVVKAENWTLSTENKQAGKFDDVVFESPHGDVLLQAKHKQNKKKITLKDLLSTNTKHSDFSLPQYFFAYQSINNFHIENIIICTNAEIQIDKYTQNLVVAQTLKTEHLLHLPGVRTILYTFEDHIKSELKANIEKYFEENLRDTNVPAEIISDKNIDDYLRHLQFVASYPCGETMEKSMENIISHLELSQNLDAETCLKFIRKKIEGWYKEKGGRYLTRANGKAYFCEIRAKLFYEGFKRYEVYFENNDWPFSFKLLHIIPRQTYIFNVIKILQALESADLNKMLFLNVDEPRMFQKLVVESFEIPQYTHLLILSSADRQIEILEEIVDKILILLNSFGYKKVILISNEDNQLVKKIKSTHFNFYKDVLGSVAFMDFTEKTRENFRKKTSIVFQGKNMCLNEMCVTDAQLNNLLCPKLLEKLAKGKRMKIGSELLKEDIETLYIPRSFNQKGYIFTEQDMCQLDGALLKVILISDSAGMGKSFVLTKLSVLLKKKYPHLWVIRIDLNMYKKYLQQCTENTINILDLLNSVDATKLKNSFETELFSLDGRIILIIDGVDEISPNYTEVVFRLLTDCNASSNFRKMFITTRPHLQDNIEDNLNVDSFRLEPFSTENQIDFITRSLESRLNVQDHIKRAKCKVYAESLVTRMALWLKESEGTFAGNPLQTRMLAEVFQERTFSSKDDLEDWEGFKEFLTSDANIPKLPRKIDLVRLYQMFVDKKREIFIYEKGNTNGNFLAEEGLEKIFKECQLYHCALALQVVLNMSQLKIFELNTDKCENFPKKNVLKIGIVQEIGENIRFIHRTFAEYFVAETILVELRRRPQDKLLQGFFVNEVLVRYEFRVVRTFLDSLIKNEVCSLPRIIFEPYHFFICENSTNLHESLKVLAEEGCVHLLHFSIECLKYSTKPIIFDLRDDDYDTIIYYAVTNLSVIQLLLEQGAAVFDAKVTIDFALHWTARWGYLNVFKYLIEKDLYVKRDRWCNQLEFASRYGHLDIVKYLIEKGVNVEGDGGYNALTSACGNGHLNIVRYLIEKGVNAKEVTEWHPLNCAALDGRLGIVKYLLENVVNVKEDTEYKLLYFAAFNGHLNVVNYLIEKGVKVKENPECHPLNYAAVNGHLNVIKYLIEGVSVEENPKRGPPSKYEFCNDVRKRLAQEMKNMKESPWCHPRNLAAINGHLNLLKTLMQGVSVEENPQRGPPISYEFFNDLLKHLAQEMKNMKESPWCHPINLASTNGHLNVVKYLVQKGVKIEEVSWSQPLNLAALFGHLNIVRYLIEKGVNVKEIPGGNPLDFAALKENPGLIAANARLNAIRRLAEEEVDANETPRCRALDFAAFNGHLDVVEYLIEKGVQVNDAPVCHPLNFAAYNGRMNVVKFLLDYDVDVNAKDSSGYTALHYAASGGHSVEVKFLIEKGIDINAVNKHGATALHCAEEKGELYVAKVLREERERVDLRVRDNQYSAPSRKICKKNVRIRPKKGK